jgi:hypothetical protein
MATLPHCQLERVHPKVVVFQSLSPLQDRTAQMRDVQRCPKAFNAPYRHCQVANWLVDIAKWQLGNVILADDEGEGNQ